MSRLLSGALFLSLVVLAPSCREPTKGSSSKYQRTEAGYLMVLREGDDAFRELERLAREQQLRGATFTGLGFGHATFGYFNREKKDYDPIELRDVELAGLTGSIAWKNDAPALHAHAVATDRAFAARGGHLLRFVVGTGSLELHVVDTGLRLTCERDQRLGANVLDFEDEP